MTNLKFRAYDKATKNHWNPPPQGVIEFDIYNVPDFIGNTFNENGEWERRFVVVKSTGLFDKNSVEIFEGDIVKHKDIITCEIEWSKSDGSWSIGSGWPICEFIHGISAVEILGNIHQHPHLLEGKK